MPGLLVRAWTVVSPRATVLFLVLSVSSMIFVPYPYGATIGIPVILALLAPKMQEVSNRLWWNSVSDGSAFNVGGTLYEKRQGLWKGNGQRLTTEKMQVVLGESRLAVYSPEGVKR